MLASSAHAEIQFDSVGILAAESVKKVDDVHQHGIVLRYRINSQSARFWMPSSLELLVGTLELGSDAGSFVSFGPSYRYSISISEADRWFVDFGVHPTYVSNTTYGGRSLGGNFHFTSYVGFGAYLGRRKKTSMFLRYQHTSNAGLDSPNPGLDMVGLTFNYHFGRSQRLFSVAKSDQK